MQLDHIAIGAADLAAAATSLGRAWGVDIPYGGRHPAMATHNRVARAGVDRYLEIIAVDPDAPAPGRPRWFSLDDARTRARLAEGPRPLAWVVRVDDLDRALAASPVDLGEPLAMRRDDLHWRLSVPVDGGLPGDGLLPALIEWPRGPHPASRMADPGLAIAAIRLEHPAPRRIAGWLGALGVDHLAEVVRGERPRLAFDIDTPRGRARL